MSARGIFRLSLIQIAILGGLANTVNAEEAGANIERLEVKGIRQPFRGDVPLKAQPQAVERLSMEQLSDAGISTLIDALDLSGSVSRQNNFGGAWDSFAVRGFVGDENVPSGYLVNGYDAGRGFGGPRDTANVESIEIMKGPGSALYGRSEPGGTINIITKKPKFSQEGYLQASAGRWDNYRFEGDYTNAITDSLAFRVNGAYEDKGSFRNPVDSEKRVLTPSLLWVASDATRFGYELEYTNQKVPFDRGIVAINGDINALPVDRYLGEASDGATQIDLLGHQFTLEHDFGDWSLLSGISYRDTALEGYSSDPELVKGRQLLFTDGETLSRQHSYRNFQSTDLSGRVELSGRVNTGDITHHMLIGADGYHFHFDKYWERYRPSPGDATYSINVFNPEYGQIAPDGALLYNQVETQDNYGIYLQDQLDLSDKWKLTLGGRFDSFEQKIENHKTQTVSNQSQNVFSPRAGVVYEWQSWLSLYGSYSEGFRPNTGSDYRGVAFEPEESKSFELGTKFELENLTGSIALFRAEKSNVLTADPVNSGFSAALGKADSQGIELDLAAYLTDNTQLMLSYAYTDAQTANDILNVDWGVSIPEGSRLINVPKHSGSLTLKHDMSLFDMDASAGATVLYVGDRLGETIDPSYELPAYTLVSLYGTYALNQHVSLQFNVNNLFDEVYYQSSYSSLWTMPGEPRSYKISVRYSF
ncbi:TonB-dependent siderophore receptor [Shewanella zhangzhouensis]|uniref:TonB-dependent siderophore receptor n=1 Tax=Shewanella zhangzhouensis TaxID=2864213 RepID=UPI001C65DF1B|nr:TonB-dependent siderophore receptor [Shewanella zhangzhouensis]QYK05859.1 TonB-dependent siderophore receptor [Shewanella zhangzhouensis]